MTDDQMHWFVIICGAIFGLVIGAIMSWPSFFGQLLPFEEVTKLFEQMNSRHSIDRKMAREILMPFITRTLLFTALGAGAGYLLTRYHKAISESGH